MRPTAACPAAGSSSSSTRSPASASCRRSPAPATPAANTASPSSAGPRRLRGRGEHGVILASESTSRGKSARPLEFGAATSGVSEQLSERGRRLATVSEILADARADEQFVFVRGRKPLRCGRAIYFRRPEMVRLVAANRFAPPPPKPRATAASIGDGLKDTMRRPIRPLETVLAEMDGMAGPRSKPRC